MSGLNSVVLFLCAIWQISQSAPIDGPCPTYWTAWGNHCYRYFGDEVSWIDAVNTCRSYSARGSPYYTDLVSIHSKEEQDFLYSYWRESRQFDNRLYHPGMWIGLTEWPEPGVYGWSDGTQVNYTNFDENQENESGAWWFMWDYSVGRGGATMHGKWHNYVDDPSWHFQFTCKMAFA